MLRNFLNAMLLALPSLSAFAQSPQPDMNMPGMSMPEREVKSDSLINAFEQHATSGTDVEPISTPREMLMWNKGAWMFMFHGTVFVNEIQQTGPRGGDKFFSTNWFMPMAQRKLGRSGILTLRTMLSLEPATISHRRYPELLKATDAP